MVRSVAQGLGTFVATAPRVEDEGDDEVVEDVGDADLHAGDGVLPVGVDGGRDHEDAPDVGAYHGGPEEVGRARGVDEVHGDEGEDGASGEQRQHDGRGGLEVVHVEQQHVPVRWEADEGGAGLRGGLTKLVAARDEHHGGDGVAVARVEVALEHHHTERGQQRERLEVDDVVEQRAVDAGRQFLHLPAARERAVGGVHEYREPVEPCEQLETRLSRVQRCVQGVRVDEQAQARVQVHAPCQRTREQARSRRHR